MHATFLVPYMGAEDPDSRPHASTGRVTDWPVSTAPDEAPALKPATRKHPASQLLLTSSDGGGTQKPFPDQGP